MKLGILPGISLVIGHSLSFQVTANSEDRNC